MKLPLLVTGFLFRREDASSTKAIDIDLVAPRTAKADLYLSPIEVAGRSFRTCPSNRHAASWVPLANACEVIGKNTNRWNKGLVDACTDGQLLSASKLNLSSGNSSIVHIVDNEGDHDADIVPGVAPSIKVGGSVVEKFEMGFAKAANASFGIMGLGRESELLDRLKREGKIGVKAFSLWIGSDVEEFQDSGANAQDKPYHGSLILGGYDFAKQKGDDYIRGPLVGGMPRIHLTGISMHGLETTQLLETKDGALDVEIDSSVPWIHLPPAIATKIRENTVENNGTLAWERKLDITMTIRLPQSGGSADTRELNITLPESIWHEGYDHVGNPKPSFKTLMPIVNSTASTAIFGRAFLKVVYLAVNYETDEFQIAPASFSTEKNIQAFPSPVNGAKSWPAKTPDVDGSDGVISPLLIGGVIGGGALVAIVLGFVLRWVRKNKDQTRKHSQDFGYSHQKSNFHSSSSSSSSSEYPTAESTPTESSESYSKVDLPTGADLGDHSNEALLIPPGFYEYGGYIHSKKLATKLDTTTLTYPTAYTPREESYTAVPKAEVCEPMKKVVTPPPNTHYRRPDCSPSSPKGAPVPIPNQVVPSPVAPFSPYSPYAVDNLWKKLPQPAHMRVHEMPC